MYKIRCTAKDEKNYRGLKRLPTLYLIMSICFLGGSACSFIRSSEHSLLVLSGLIQLSAGAFFLYASQNVVIENEDQFRE